MASSNGANAGHGAASSDDTARGGGEGDVAQKLSDLARALQDEDDVESTLQAITKAAVGTIPGAQYAAISVVERRREVHTRAGTADVVFKIDQAQYDAGEGPCLSAVYEQPTVRLPDMASEERWPDFTRRAADLGVLSMLSFQLYVQGDSLGALNLYSAEKDAFSDESGHIGLLFASHAAVAMVGAQQQEHMNKAIRARDVIGQAKGILMERYKVTADQAFTLLAQVSQQTNTKLVDIARSLADTGHLRKIPRS
jgi:transcriptional regulator with GAF, ATPase, and Fis domain